MKTTSTTSVSPTLNRSIFFFYEKALRYVPILLMLCHWYGVYSFHDNPREIVIDIRENEECIAYLYFMLYIFPVVFMLPASHFFKLCWIWRIPFVYIIGTNAIRIYYRSWFRDRSRLLQKSCELARSFLQDEDTDHPSDKIWWYVNS